MKLVVYLLLILLFAGGCQRENIARGNIAKKSIDSIPMEYVDTETNGKKGGGTHFSLSSDELFLDYQYFDDEAGARTRFDEAPRDRVVKRVIEQGDVVGNGGVIEGKFSFTENDSRYENLRYCLKWSRANRYANVCSESRQAIDEFRTVYDF